MKWNNLLVGILVFSFAAAVATLSAAAEVGDGEVAIWRAGFAKVDITPKEPVRMAGYGNRDRPSEGIDSPLAVRCLALQHAENDDAPHLLISIDTIGLPGSLSREISQTLLQQHGVGRDHLVLASTHTHCGPDLVSELSNIFATPLSEAEREAGLRYKAQLTAAVIEAAGKAIADLQPAKLDYGSGKATFAANRRVLTGGRWSGFGVQGDGPVDHTAAVLRITAPDEQLRGIVFNYACHATTLGGDHYRINGDWPGYAAEMLEARHEGIVALSTIGCGADANPQPRGKLEDAVTHGRNLADEVERVINAAMRPIEAPLDSRFDHASLSFELPTIEEVRQRSEDPNPQTRRHALTLDAIYKRDGRLPATYPVPIQAWQFGDQLTMIFIGGEVVVDYALRLKRELQDNDLWVTAYANDVLGYIASERMRREGGYEYDRSTIFYGLPGPWAAGSEDHLISQIRELLESNTPQSPVSANEALETLQLSSDAYRVELVAAEPLVQDPINLAFGADGRLWVVEMGDYPRGTRGGRVKFLEDTTGDGRYDQATIFLDNLSFPTGVFPWRDGVLISVAPDILFASDTDGDGTADRIEPLYSGFALANPQHRINGFSYGLDHSLHCASGDNLGEITSHRSGEVINASGHDVQIWPDDGRIATISGRTQFVRSRDDWGQWFGNDNSRPMYQYPIEAAYLRRNPSVQYASGSQQLFDPPVAPPVFPITSTAVRYNDLFAANRFTSACSSILSRSHHFHVDDQQAIFICEPVHNLVHRGLLVPTGASYRATRSTGEQDREFLASTDPWFRPVRCAIGPDGALWVVDMYRETIEHPAWIPEAWQQQLDLTAGSDRGRIYRIVPSDMDVPLPPSITAAGPQQLIEMLDSPIGPLRDLASQLLVERAAVRSGEPPTSDTAAFDSVAESLLRLASGGSTPQGRVHALSILEVTGQLTEQVLVAALADSHPGVLRVATRLAESRLEGSAEILQLLGALAAHEDLGVVLGVALALGETADPAAGKLLAQIAGRPDLDRWVTTAILSSAAPHARTILGDLLAQVAQRPAHSAESHQVLLAGLIATAIASDRNVTELLQSALSGQPRDAAALDAQLTLAISAARSFQQAGVDRREDWRLLEPVYRRSLQLAADDDQDEARRCRALELVGIGLGTPDKERQLLDDLISPSTAVAVQRQAIGALQRCDPERFVASILGRWPSLSYELRSHCVSQMLTRAAWTGQLLTALEEGVIDVRDLSAAARQQLLHSGTRSMMVRAQRLLQSPGGSSPKQELVQTMLAQFKPGGDHSRDQSSLYQSLGARVFAKHCGACHTPDDQGRTVGPNLANLSDRSDQALVEAILDPNRAVDPAFQSYLIRTEDDEILVGAIEQELADTITLARPDGTRTLVNRRSIAEIKSSGVSVMPEGFEELISSEELQAVVRYLQQTPGGSSQ